MTVSLQKLVYSLCWLCLHVKPVSWLAYHLITGEIHSSFDTQTITRRVLITLLVNTFKNIKHTYIYVTLCAWSSGIWQPPEAKRVQVTAAAHSNWLDQQRAPYIENQWKKSSSCLMAIHSLEALSPHTVLESEPYIYFLHGNLYGCFILIPSQSYYYISVFKDNSLGNFSFSLLRSRGISNGKHLWMERTMNTVSHERSTYILSLVTLYRSLFIIYYSIY